MAAALFAILFVAIWIASNWAASQFGAAGVYVLAAIVGVTDIDAFVLSVAQGGSTSLSEAAATTAILIATTSNNVLKADYTVAFAGWRGSLPAVAILALLSGRRRRPRPSPELTHADAGAEEILQAD